MRPGLRKRAGDGPHGAGVLQRVWAALRGNASFKHLEASDRWATWQRPDGEEQDDARPAAPGAPTDQRD